MREVKKYICEICNTEYNDDKKCEKCEKSHIKAGKIVRERHLSIGKNGSGYPITITVRMSDGTEQVYKRG